MEKEIDKITGFLDDLKEDYNQMVDTYEEKINELNKYVGNLETENEHNEEVIQELSLEIETLKKKVIVLEADLLEASMNRRMFIPND